MTDTDPDRPDPGSSGAADEARPSPYPDEALPSPYPDEVAPAPARSGGGDGEAPASPRRERSPGWKGGGGGGGAARRRPSDRGRRSTSREMVPVAAGGALERPGPSGPVALEPIDDEVPPWYEDEFYEYADDWGTLPARSSTWRRVVLFLVGLSVVVFAAGWFVYQWVTPQLDPAGPPGDEIPITIPEGAATNDIARILGDEGVVPSGVVFKYYLQWKDAGDFQAGVYLLNENMAVWEARDVLAAGPQPTGSNFFVIPEGLRNEQMVALVTDLVPEFDPEAFAEAVAAAPVPPVLGDPAQVPSSEGFLFGAGYDVDLDPTGDEGVLVQRMVDKFEEVATETNLADAESLVGRTPYEVLIVASLIEEEALVESERARIARVIYNRLDRDEPLGIDATTLYQLALEGRDGDDIRLSDFDPSKPYDTRVRRGLPPTPISAPSKASIEAALAPEEGPWIFYARTDENGEGTHTFSVTAEEHEVAVERCRELGYCT